MSGKVKLVVFAILVVAVVGFTYYVFTAPYSRFPGVRIGGELTPPPADWNSVAGENVVLLKLAGFPPFVVNIFYTTDAHGIITATRPDDGYWGRRLRENPDGWLRIGESTYALTATEIFGDERIPYLESYGAKYRMNMAYDFDGEIITGQNEPLHTWEVFYWTER